MQAAPAPQLTPVQDIEEIISSHTTQHLVSVVGRVKFNGPVESIITKGKYLKKQEATITDHTKTIRLVLWENDISKVKNDGSYKLQKVMVRIYNNEKYLTLNKNSIIAQTQETFDREEDINIANSFRTVATPANGVPAIQRFMSCFKCKTKIVADGESELVKCSECGRGQLKVNCPTRLFATVEFLQEEEEEIVLNIFEDKLQSLYELYKTQFGEEKSFDQLSDDDIMVMCLKVKSTVYFNSKRNVIAIN